MFTKITKFDSLFPYFYAREFPSSIALRDTLMAIRRGLEPLTSAVTGQRSTLLN